MLDTSHHPGGKQLPTWQLDFPFYPASEGKHQLTTSNLTERSVSQTPAVTPLGHTYASVPMLPSPEHCGVETVWWRSYNKNRNSPISFFLPSILLSIQISHRPILKSYRRWVLKDLLPFYSEGRRLPRELWEGSLLSATHLFSITPATHLGHLMSKNLKICGAEK